MTIQPALLVLFTSFASAPVEASEPTPPKPWLKQMVDKAAKLAKRKVKPDTAEEKKWRAESKAIIDDMLDWDEMTQRSLGRQWEARSPEERTEFAGLLREMIEASYGSKLRLATRGDAKKPKKIEITWLEESVKKNKAKVSAKVKSDKRVVVLEFAMLWNGARWRVYDVAIDEVSTVRHYRSQFRKFIKDEGFDGLLARMRSKTKEIREGRADLAP